MPLLDSWNGMHPLLAQINGSPSKGFFKFCGPFTDCPDNAPSWLPIALFAGFVALVLVLSRISRSKGKYKRIARGPKPIRPFENAPPDRPRGPDMDE